MSHQQPSQRIQKLEELVAHQEHLLHQINDVLVRLRGEHDALRSEVRGQLEKLSFAIEQARSGPSDPNEKPPHY